MRLSGISFNRGLRFRIMTRGLISFIPMPAIVGIVYLFNQNTSTDGRRNLTVIMNKNCTRNINAFIGNRVATFREQPNDDIYYPEIKYSNIDKPGNISPVTGKPEESRRYHLNSANKLKTTFCT